MENQKLVDALKMSDTYQTYQGAGFEVIVQSGTWASFISFSGPTYKPYSIMCVNEDVQGRIDNELAAMCAKLLPEGTIVDAWQ